MYRVVLAGLMVVAVALRAPSLGVRSLWLDEAWLADQVLSAPAGDEPAPQDPFEMLAPVPPLFALALRGVGAVVGRSAGGLRSLPFASSVAAVPLAYLAARAWFGRGAGLAAAACFAVYPTAVTYGQELKQYSTDVLAVLLLLVIGESVRRRPDHRLRWIGLALAEGVTPGLSYPATLVLPAVALGLLAVCRRSRWLVAWLVTHAVTVAVALGWWMAVLGTQRARPAVLEFWAAGFPPPGVGPALQWFAEQLLDIVGFAVDRPAWLFALAAFSGLALAPRRVKTITILVLASVLGAAVLRLYPFTPARTSLFLVPFIYIPLAAVSARAAAWSVSGRWPWMLRGAGLLGALALLAFPARGSLHPTAGLMWEETEPLVSVLRAERRAGDRVYVYCGAVPAFRFYLPEIDERVTLGGSHRHEVADYEAELRALLVPGERLWLFFSHVYPGEDEAILADMRIYGRLLTSKRTRGASLYLFTVERGADSVIHLRAPPPSS